MDINEMVNLITNGGIAVVVLAYALWKDYKFTNQINETLTKLSDAIDEMKQLMYLDKTNKKDEED